MLAPWYVRSRPLHDKTGADIFQALYGQSAIAKAASSQAQGWQAIATLLESPAQLSPETPQARLAR